MNRIAISIKGGMVQSIVALEDVEITLIDYDLLDGGYDIGDVICEYSVDGNNVDEFISKAREDIASHFELE